MYLSFPKSLPVRHYRAQLAAKATAVQSSKSIQTRNLGSFFKKNISSQDSHEVKFFMQDHIMDFFYIPTESWQSLCDTIEHLMSTHQMNTHTHYPIVPILATVPKAPTNVQNHLIQITGVKPDNYFIYIFRLVKELKAANAPLKIQI